MTDREQGSKDMATGERMKTLAGAMTDTMIHKAKGKHETEDGARHTMDMSTVEH